MAATPWQLGLEAMRSDERLRRRAARAAASTPAERLAEAAELARAAADFIERLPPDVQARLRAYREPPGPGALDVLRRLLRGP